METEHIKYKDLSKIKQQLLKKQRYRCAICGDDLKQFESRDICVDHEHFGEGRIRSVLCRRCNAVEGKLYNVYKRYTARLRKSSEDYLKLLKGLYKYPTKEVTKYIHPKAIKRKRRKK